MSGALLQVSAGGTNAAGVFYYRFFMCNLVRSKTTRGTSSHRICVSKNGASRYALLPKRRARSVPDFIAPTALVRTDSIRSDTCGSHGEQKRQRI